MSTFLYITDMTESQASKYLTHNNAVHRNAVMSNLVVKDRDLTTAPGGPTAGDAYIVKPSTTTGTWSSKGNQVAFYDNGWKFLVPQDGWRAYIQDEDVEIFYCSGTTSWKYRYPERVKQTVTCSSSVTVNWSMGGIAQMTFETTVPTAQLTFSGGTDCPKCVLRLRQSSSGGNAVTFTSEVRGSTNSTSPPKLSTGVNKIDYLGYIYNSSGSRFDFVSLAKGY